MAVGGIDNRCHGGVHRTGLAGRNRHGPVFDGRDNLRIVKCDTVLVQRERLPFRRQRDRLVRRRKKRHNRAVRRRNGIR